jgi:hypothetical protein
MMMSEAEVIMLVVVVSGICIAGIMWWFDPYPNVKRSAKCLDDRHAAQQQESK